MAKVKQARAWRNLIGFGLPGGRRSLEDGQLTRIPALGAGLPARHRMMRARCPRSQEAAPYLATAFCNESVNDGIQR